MNVRLSRAFLSELDGSSLMSDPANYDPDLGPPIAAKIRAARQRADGSVTIDATDAERYLLVEYAEAMVDATGDCVADDFGSAMATINTGRAFIRKYAR